MNENQNTATHTKANFRGNQCVGQKYNRWTVLEAFRLNGRTMAKCKCDCGNEGVVDLYTVKKGLSHSCGCYNAEAAIRTFTTHGYSGDTTYRAWNAMKHRCLCKTSKEYPNWGGRGITICPQWIDSFETFLKDMGERPKGMSLDRIDNNGNYEPSNCRWATHSQQMKNRRPFKIGQKKSDRVALEASV